MSREDSRPRFKRWLLLLLLLLGAAGVLATLRTGAPPEVKLSAALPGIGRRTPVTIELAAPGRGLAGVEVELVQHGEAHTLVEKSYAPRPAWAFWGPATESDRLSVDVGRETVEGLKPGEATLRATAARAGTWLLHPAPTVAEITLPVRLSPPSLQVTSSQTYVAQGGCEAVVYRVGESTVRDGVRAGDWWFPGHPLPGGAAQDRFALFAVPYDMGDASVVRLEAADDVGNLAEAAFVDQFTPRPFKTDTIRVTDDFLARVVPEILSRTPEIEDKGDLLASYLAINGDLRHKDGEALKALAAKSADRFLWDEPFLPMRNAKVMSSFADRRTYVYDNRPVDKQDHLGFDLAATRRSPVPAVNRGVVLMARYFGIYGNAVVIDHGYGLMSLYGHLSSLEVKEGQAVDRGQLLGHTGETGLAGGDHLHFTILLDGLPVTPVEWWDAHWVRDRLVRKLGRALPFSG